MQKMAILLSISGLFFNLNVSASWFNDHDIDYWNENKKIESDKKLNNMNSTEVGVSEIRKKDREPFDWSNYSDPSKIEFYDDGGDFVPSRPWREVMSNPIKENIEKYMAWQAKKIELSNKIGKIMSESSGMPTPLASQPKLGLSSISGAKENPPEHEIQWSKLQILYFYRTSCHFCQASTPVVATLKEHHVLFIPVQLDWQENHPMYYNSVRFDESLLKGGYKIKGTPTWIIKRADKPNAEPLIIEGYVSSDQMEKSIKSVF